MKDALTEDQKNKLKKLVNKHMFMSFFITIKFVFFAILSSFLTVAVNAFYVKSDSFVFPVAIINMIFLMHFMLQETSAGREQFNKEVKNILHPEENK